MAQSGSIRPFIVLSTLCLAMAVTSAQAGITKSWDGGDGNFNEPAKWTPDGIPGATDDVEISAAGTYVVTLSDNRSIQSLVIGGVSGTQTLKIANPGVLTLAQASTINSNGIVQWEGGQIIATGPLSNAGTINVATAGSQTLIGTLNNTKTILQTAGSTLTLCSGTLNNLDGGLYELQDGTLASGCSGNNFNNNSGGIFRKTTAATTAAVNVSFNNNLGGLVDVQAGKLSFGSAGTATGSEYTVAGGATLELGSTLTLSGTIMGTGAGTLSLITGGSLQLADGTMASINFAGALFQWQAGNIMTSGSAILTNAGTINVATAGAKALIGTLNNTSTILQTTGSTLTPCGGTLNNLDGGLYELQDGTLASGCSGNSFNNNSGGIFRKTTAATTATVNLLFNNNAGGLVDVQAGKLSFVSAGTATGSEYTVASGATLELGSTLTLSGTVMGTGAGTLSLITGGTLQLADGTMASIDFAGSLFQWQGGNIMTSGSAILTNAGTINVATAGAKALIGTLNNTSTILQTAGSTLTPCGGTLNNLDGGLYELQDGTLASGCSGNSFNNNSGGIFRKTTAATTAAVNVRFNNNVGGLVDVQAGKLSFVSAGTATGSEYTVASGATLELGSTLTLSGTIMGTGAGTLSLITGGTLQLADTTTASIDFAGALFQWQGGQLNLLGSALLTNAGTINVVTAGSHTLIGTLNNADTIAHSGGGTLTLFNGTLNNQVGGLYDLQAGSLAGGATFGNFNNSGTFKKITAGASVAEVTFVNNSAGLVDVSTGTLDMRRSFTNQGTVAVTDATFDGPATYTQTAGTTTLDDGTLIATNVDVQGGRLDGNGTVQASVQNAGTVAPGLFSAGLLEVTGTYSQTAAGILEIELGGTTQVQFDRLEVTGAATLDGPLDVSLINSFTPQQPDTFEVMTYASRTGTFDFTSPPIPGGLTMVADHLAASLILRFPATVPAQRPEEWEGVALLLLGLGIGVRHVARHRGRPVQ